MTTAYRLRPWTEVVTPHHDVASGDLAMGTYAANLAAVAYATRTAPPVYSDPSEFYRSTFLTPAMRKLLGDVCGVLHGKPGDHALQLRTPFGGGKTHTLLALYHLATAREQVAAVTELDGIPDPGAVRLAVLSGEYLDPQRGRQLDGRTIRTLWGELAYQLGGWAAYEGLLVDGDEGTPPGGELLAKLLYGAPTLILLDEVLVYIAKGKAIRRGDSTAGQQALLFVQNLSEAVNQQPCTAMVYSLQASVGEAASEEGLLTALEHITARVDQRREPVSGDEVLRVVQRRLFEALGEPGVAGEVADVYAQLLRDELRASAETDDDRREADQRAKTLARRIKESYPFHPELIDVMYQRWGSLPSYQRTRGALQFLATVVHALWERRGDLEPQPLIGPGDVDLADEPVRTSFFEQVGEANQYAAVVQSDFLGADAGARVVDERIGRVSPALRSLRVGTRVATAIALLSFGAREGEERGALEPEVIEAALVPGLDGNVLRDALHQLRRETLLYLHYTGRRYRFETRPNLNMLITTEENKLTAEEVVRAIRSELERALGARPADVAIWPQDGSQIPDGKPVFIVAYLPPDSDGAPEALARLVSPEGAGRANKNGLALVVANGIVADSARRSARTALAVEGLIGRASQHQFDAEQREELKERAHEAHRSLTTSIGQLYERIYLPVGPDGPGGVRCDVIELGTVLAAGRSIHERVRDALTHHVFDSLVPKRVVSLSRLGERRLVWCEELAAAFFRFYEFTKLWSLDPLLAAIAEGVARGELGYAIGVEGEPPEIRVDPSLLHIEETIAADEIDLGPGAALLAPELAKSLKSHRVTDEAGLLVQQVAASNQTTVITADSSSTLADTDDTAAAPADHARTVHLRISASERDLHPLNLALTGLRDIVRPGNVIIEVVVSATKPDGSIEPVTFQNRVRQHLEEAGLETEERWE